TLLDERDKDGGGDHKMHLVAWSFDGTILREIERRTFYQGWISSDKKALAFLTKIEGSEPQTCRLQFYQLDNGKMLDLGTVPDTRWHSEFSPRGRFLLVDIDREEREPSTIRNWFQQWKERLTGKPLSPDDHLRNRIIESLDMRVWDLTTGKETALP